MDIKLIIKIIILIIVILIIGCVLLVILFNRILGTQISSDIIIKSFEDSKDLFGKSIEELSIFEEMSIRQNKNIFEIHIYEHTSDGKVNVIKIEEKDFYKYEQTINLMKSMKIKSLNKYNGNIGFLLETALSGTQEIAYIINPNEDNTFMGYRIKERQQLEGNWYYIVSETL